MFLDDIEKDKIGYVENCKNQVMNYLIDFFGEKYKEEIESKLNEIMIIFLNENHACLPCHFYSSRVDTEVNFLYKKWLRKSFPNHKIEIDNNEHLSEFEELLYSDEYGSLNNLFQIIANTDDSITKKEIENCKKIFEEEFEEKLNQLSILKFKLFKESEKATKITLINELKENKFIEPVYENLSEYQKQQLFKCYVAFSMQTASNGALYSNSKTSLNESNPIEAQEYFNFVLFKDIRLTFLQTFVHELIHVISMNSLLLKDNYGYYSIEKCGVKVTYFSFGEKIDKQIEYSLINEIITDYFAYNITQKMFEDGNEYFLSSLNNSTYAQCFILVKPLLDKYFEEFKDCYMSKKPYQLKNFIGKDNLNTLDALVEEFSCVNDYLRNKNFGLVKSYEEGLKEAKLPESLYVNPMITKYNRCFAKMENLIKDIDEYVKSNKQNSKEFEKVM